MMDDQGSSSGSAGGSEEGDEGLISRLLILYASETGNAQDCAERLGREVRRKGRRCTVLSMDEFNIHDLPSTPLVVLITSTHGRGDPPPAMQRLWERLLRTSLPHDILEDVNFALFGLGDSSYERFAYAGKLLHRRMLALGANPVMEPVWGDERAPDGLEQSFGPWLAECVELMVPHLEQVRGWEEQERWAMPPPIYRIEWADESSPERVIEQLRLEPKGHEEKGHGLNGNVKLVPESEWKPRDWKWAHLKRNERVTKEGWWQDVREIELEWEDSAEGIERLTKSEAYPPGSICNLLPTLSDAEVDEFLDMNRLTHLADRPFRLYSTIPNQPFPTHLPPPGTLVTLHQLLKQHVDLRCSPRKSFFEWLRRLTSEEREEERLDDFLNDPEEIFTYATRPSRTILETLADFRATTLPLSHLVEILPPLRRRQFSIASSSGSLEIGDRVAIKISPPTLFLPPSPMTPVVLVGPGTGVAPMRAFLEERVRQGAAKQTILYFGCRSASQDLYYASEWEDYRKLGVQIRVAASRDQEEKLYVQHLIRKDWGLIRDWILDKEGWLYICGSSNAMPREVREAVAWCISRTCAPPSAHGDLKLNGEPSGMDEDEAKAYVDRMFDEGRGGEESW